ncbi:MAG: translocation/assembly module TamB domain-containing protein, partial [Actinomycetota bacterium]
RLLGRSPRLQGLVSVQGGGVRVEGARLDGAAASLWASGSVGTRLALWIDGRLPDLSVLGPAGSAEVRGRVEGTADDPLARGLAVVRSDAVEGLVGFGLGRQGGPLSVDASARGRRVEGTARLDLEDGWAVDAIALRSGTTTLTGQVRQGVSGRLELAAPDLAPWSSLAGIPLRGAATAVADLDPAGARLSASGSGVELAGIPTQTLRLDATLSGLGRAPAADFTLDATGTSDHPAGLSAAGTARPGDLRLMRLRLARNGAEARLAAPARLAWGGGRVRLAPAVLAVGEGRVRLSGGVAGQRLDGVAELDGVPLAVIEAVLPGGDVVGRASGTMRLAGTTAAPVVVADLDGREVGFAAAARAGIGRLALSVHGRWADGRVAGRIDARDGERLAVHGEGSVPLPAEGPIAARVSVDGDLARLSELLPSGGNELSGRLSARGSVGGTMAAPAIEGVATLRGGRFENPEAGTIVTELAATATVTRTGAVRFEADGGDGAGGHVRLAGNGDVAAGRWQGRLGLAGFRLLRRDELAATVSGELGLTGQGSDGRLAGTVTVDPAEVDIGRLKGAGGVPHLDVVEVNGPVRPPPPAPRRGAAQGPMTVALGLDVDVRHAFVRGRGLDSEWEGRLQVAGTLSHPVLTGRASPERGTYDLLGRSFKLDRDSTVTFTGGDTIDPALAVTAEAKAKDITARVVVGGTAHAPEVDFTSDPPLARDEVLARLLFGQGGGGLSALQQIELGRLAAGNLLGGGEEGGFDPVGDIRNALGLDVLSVGGGDQTASGGAANPSVSAGKYIGPDTFVRVQQGTGGLGKVTVEQDLGAGFSVESSVGQQTGGGVGLTWRKDY